MGVKVRVETTRMTDLRTLAVSLGSDTLQQAAALGLNEHTQEQKRQSVVRISAFTGVPAGYVRSKASVLNATAGGTMNSEVRVRDKALNVAQFGKPVWSQAMPGAEITGWNVRRMWKGVFVRNGKAYKYAGTMDPRRGREGRYPIKQIWGPVLPNELIRRDWRSATPNPEMAERYMASDLTSRVFRIMAVKMGF